MSLKQFHIFFIGLCVGLGVFLTYFGWGSSKALFSALFVCGLILYLVWFLRQPLFGALVLALTSSSYSQACAVCFGDEKSAMVKGANAGTAFLLAVVSAVLVGIAGVTFSWVRRAQRITS